MGAGGTERASAARARRSAAVVDRDHCGDHRRCRRAAAHAVHGDDVAAGRSRRGKPPRPRALEMRAEFAQQLEALTARIDANQQANDRLPGRPASRVGRASRRVRQSSASDADDDQRQARQPSGIGAGRVAGPVRRRSAEGLRDYLEHKTAAVETQIDELHKSSRRFDEQAASIVSTHQRDRRRAVSAHGRRRPAL